MTRGRLITRVALALGLTNEAGHAELTLLEEWANEAVVDVLEETHCRVELGDLTLQVDVWEYRVDQSVLAVDGKTITGATYEFNVVSLDELYDLRRRGEVTTGYGGSISAIAIEGDLLLVYPTPSEAQVIRYVYVAKPSEMTDDAHDPADPVYGGIPSEHHLALEYYMLWRGAEYDDKQAAMTPKDYREAYEGLLKKVRKKTRHKALPGLTPARVGYPGRNTQGRRNDQYPGR